MTARDGSVYAGVTMAMQGHAWPPCCVLRTGEGLSCKWGWCIKCSQHANHSMLQQLSVKGHNPLPD